MLTRLRWSAAVLAVVWAVAMFAWSPAPRGLPNMIILSIAGAFVGLLWHAALKRYLARQAARRA